MFNSEASVGFKKLSSTPETMRTLSHLLLLCPLVFIWFLLELQLLSHSLSLSVYDCVVGERCAESDPYQRQLVS